MRFGFESGLIARLRKVEEPKMPRVPPIALLVVDDDRVEHDQGVALGGAPERMEKPDVPRRRHRCHQQLVEVVVPLPGRVGALDRLSASAAPRSATQAGVARAAERPASSGSIRSRSR